MSAPPRLAGLRVLVTRPAAQAENLCRMIEAAGGTAVRLPLVAIERTAHPAEAQRRLAAGHALWIFTSANAVRQALPLLPGDWPKRVAALGAATADALAAAGAANAIVPLSGSSSEALLAHAELADVRGQRILLVTGEGGRDLIERELAARGAAVERAETYRRVRLPYPPDAVAAALRRSDVIVATSAGLFEHLVQLAPAAVQARLKRLPLVAPSARVVDTARNLGWHGDCRIAEPVTDSALCEACAAFVPREEP